MQIRDSVVLVTGANRGLGQALVAAALARGARKVYAAARDPASVAARPGVVPVRLDITDPAGIAALAEACGDVDLLINNAGIARLGGTLAPNAIDDLRAHLETNAIGLLNVSRAFAPVLAANSGGALLNVLSVASWLQGPPLATYAVSKAAAWAINNALRVELAAQGTQVSALHMGFVDTELTRGLDVPKTRPEDIAAIALDGVEQGAVEILADDLTRSVKAGLSTATAPYLAGAGRDRPAPQAA